MLFHRSQFSPFNYDLIPPGYYYEVMMNGHVAQRYWHREKFRRVASRVVEGEKVLDIGCGPGAFLAVLGTEKFDVRAVGVDIAKPQVQFANQNIASRFPGGRISFRALGSEDYQLPFEDASFDVVTCIEVIEHLHPHIAYLILQEARRVLQPGGRIIVTTPNYRSLWPLIEKLINRLSPVQYEEQHVSKFTPSSCVKFLETVGFRIGRVETLFILAPFLSVISPWLAQFSNQIEKIFFGKLGSLLIVEGTPEEQLRNLAQKTADVGSDKRISKIEPTRAVTIEGMN